MQVYIVGGYVRDLLLKSTDGYSYIPKDKDMVVVGATWDYMNTLFGNPVGKDFPVWLDKDGNEIALARVERSTGNGYNDFACTTEGVTLEDDLGRRDLTINAMAVPEHLGVLVDRHDVIDPFNGLEDLANKVLRHTTDAFSEDPLRVLRVARFYARYGDIGFTVAPETRELCAKMVADGMLNHLPKERIWAETLKALECKESYRYFTFLRDVGFCPVLSGREIMNIKTFTSNSTLRKEDYLLAKWACFDHRNRLTRVFGATKRFNKCSEILMYLNDLNVFDSSCTDTLRVLGAYQNGSEFDLAVAQMSDRVALKTVKEIVQHTKHVKVDVEPGPAYGAALAAERRWIAEGILRGQ